jgi:hypothetical protein
VRTGFQIIVNPDTKACSTFNSEQMESGKHHLAGYNADRNEAFDGSQIHHLLNLLTDQVRTFHPQSGDPRSILVIFD